MGVLQQHPLVLFELLPDDVPLVMVANKDIPVCHRLVVTHRLFGATVDDPGPLTPPAEGPGVCVGGAGVERVGSTCTTLW